MKQKNFAALGAVSLLLLVGAGCSSNPEQATQIPAGSTAPTTENYNANSYVPPEQKTETTQLPDNNQPTMKTETDQKKTLSAVLHTSEGDIEIVFNSSATPKTVNNFVTLAKKNFYDNTIFHRVIKGFMIQGGDPTGTGSGGPGYKFADEPFEGSYTRGTVAMANAGPNTNGSQFFIMHADVPLPKNYVIFGHVTQGLDVVDKIATAKVVTSAMGEPSTPVNPVKIKSVDIVEK